MNTSHIEAPKGSGCLLNLVDFKWLMAGMGWWVNLSRLQGDKDYLDECLQRALTSDSELLQKRSIEMLGVRRGPEAHCDTDMSSP